jgi:recombination protein RecT
MTDIVPYEQYQEIVSYGRSQEVMETFSRLVGRNAPHYIQSAIIAVQANDRLMQCTPRSIFRSALRAATLRLTCDPALGHAWLVPYKNKNGVLEAQFQAGWKGVQHMALRTGKYRYINVAPVYEGEEVIEDRITGSLKIEGVLTSPKREKGLIASFALLSGLQKSIYMTNEEMEDHGKKYSKGYTKSDGIWMTNKRAAYHKTILLKLLRTYGYLDPSDAAILEDEQAEVSDLELPEESEITIVERKPLSTKEANKLLGFEDDEDEPEVEQEPVMEVEIDMAEESPKPVTNKYARPMDPEVLREALQTKAAKAQPASEKQTNLVRVLLLEHFADRDDERHQAQEYLTGQKSFSDIDPKMITALLDWMKPTQSSDGSGAYELDKNAKIELTMVARRFMENLGQQKLEV